MKDTSENGKEGEESDDPFEFVDLDKVFNPQITQEDINRV